VPLEVLVPDLLLQRRTKCPVAQNDEADIRYLPDDHRRGLDQVMLGLVCDQRADVADDR
jgi:hypothetical protein